MFGLGGQEIFVLIMCLAIFILPLLLIIYVIIKLTKFLKGKK